QQADQCTHVEFREHRAQPRPQHPDPARLQRSGPDRRLGREALKLRCRAFPYVISREMLRGRRWKETVVLNLEPTPGFEPGTFSLPRKRWRPISQLVLR